MRNKSNLLLTKKDFCNLMITFRGYLEDSRTVTSEINPSFTRGKLHKESNHYEIRIKKVFTFFCYNFIEIKT